MEFCNEMLTASHLQRRVAKEMMVVCDEKTALRMCCGVVVLRRGEGQNETKLRNAHRM